jgi:hypothetical protein
MAFILWSRTTKENIAETIMAFLSLALFPTFAYLRLYFYYRLQKTRKRTDQKDFVGFFDNMSIEKLLPHMVLPLPLIQKMQSNQEGKLKLLLNISTLLSWVFFVLMLWFFPNVK